MSDRMIGSGRFFCAAQSRRNKEFIYGTAPRVDSWVLLEYSGPWKPNAIEESNLPAELRHKLTNLGRGGRALFIRQSHEFSAPVTCFGVNTHEVAPETHRAFFGDYGELNDLDLLSMATRPGAKRVDRPLFLVCTHGTHDKCCAKFGLPIYEALCERVGANTWQCSHIGGDRFAANIICFPHGIYYGHVSIADAKKIVDAQQRGEIYLKNYRGRCCYTRAGQVAEYFVRSETGRMGLEDFQLVDSERTFARFRSSDGIHEVEFRPRDGLCELLTCKSETPRIVVQYELVRHSLTKI